MGNEHGRAIQKQICARRRGREGVPPVLRAGKERPADYRRQALRARFHLRHARQEECGGVRAYVLEPEGAPKGTVLLIHGWAAEASFMAVFAEALRRIGYRAALFDLPAHGRSQGRTTNLAACARAAHRVATAFGPLHGIIGHSLGALISLWIAEGGPPLGVPTLAPRIALLACPNRFIDVMRNFGGKLDLCVHGQLGFERRISRVGGRPVGRFSAAGLLGALETDILAVHSADDERVPFADAEAIAAASRRVRLMRVEGLGHAKLLYDGTVIRSVASFIAGADP